MIVAGVVRGVVPADTSVIVEHEDVPGFMPSMTMPFRAKSIASIEGLAVGDAIEFDLIVTFAVRELHAAVLTRLVIAFSVIALLAGFLPLFADVTGDLTATASSILLASTLYIIPLLALFMATTSAQSETEEQAFLMSQPVTRGSRVLGKFFALWLLVAGAALLLVLPAGFASTQIDALAFIWFHALGIGGIFSSLGLAIGFSTSAFGSFSSPPRGLPRLLRGADTNWSTRNNIRFIHGNDPADIFRWLSFSGIVQECFLLFVMINPSPSNLPVALVTGSSSGIGAAIAERLAAEGFLSLINARSENAGALRTREAIRAAGNHAELAIGDLSNVSEIRRIFHEIRDRYGRIDVLVNNAGVCPFHEWDEVTEDVWDQTHNTNLKAGYFCTQEAAKLMIEKKTTGRIMVISSISAIKGGTVQTHYCPTKGGQISMMNAFAVCLGGHGITCNSILPGTIETPINAEYLATGHNRANLEIQTCVGYIGMPADVAGLVAFLARPEARYITGGSFLVDGGELVKHL